ncbi:MAG: response regulator [Planctomycetota bacterium]
MSRILVGEDNPHNARLIATVLEEAGYAVRMASTGKEVIHEVAHAGYALVIIDLSMPDMDGWSVLAAVRDLHGKRDLPALGISGYANDVGTARFHRAGFDAFVRKPIARPELLSKVEALIGNGTRRIDPCPAG